MADKQIGNHLGLAVAGRQNRFLATVTADGANTVTVDTPANIRVGENIDIVHKTTKAVLASNRQVTNLTSAGVLTYGGADVAATTSHGVYSTGEGVSETDNNNNGGVSDSDGFELRNALTIDQMRTRLAALDGTTYTAAVLNVMTENDMVFALRILEPAGDL